jgi:hypothetical protein
VTQFRRPGESTSGRSKDERGKTVTDQPMDEFSEAGIQLARIIEDRLAAYPDQEELGRWRAEHPGVNFRPVEGVDDHFSLFLHDRDSGADFTFGEFTSDELETEDTTPWAAAITDRPVTTNILQLVVPALALHPQRDRIQALLDRGIPMQGPEVEVLGPDEIAERAAAKERLQAEAPEDVEIVEIPQVRVWIQDDETLETYTIVTFPVTAMGRYVDMPEDPDDAGSN